MFGLIEVMIPFAIVLIILLRELWVLRSLRKQDERKAAVHSREQSGPSQ